MGKHHKKPRADSKLKSLGREKQEALYSVLMGSEEEPAMSYDQAAVWVRSQWSLDVSPSSLSEFYSWFSLRVRMECAEARAKQAQDEILKANPDVSPDALARVGQVIFTNEAIGSGDAKTFVMVSRLMLDKDKLRLDREKLELRIREYEEKVAKAASTMKDKNLSPEEREIRIKEIFGMG